jgi:hypothetical protein
VERVVGGERSEGDGREMVACVFSLLLSQR